MINNKRTTLSQHQSTASVISLPPNSFQLLGGHVNDFVDRVINICSWEMTAEYTHSICKHVDKVALKWSINFPQLNNTDTGARVLFNNRQVWDNHNGRHGNTTDESTELGTMDKTTTKGSHHRWSMKGKRKTLATTRQDVYNSHCKSITLVAPEGLGQVREGTHSYLCNTVIDFHGQDPLAEALCSRWGVGHLGGVELWVGDVLLADLGHDVGWDVVAVVLLQHAQEVHVAQ